MPDILTAADFLSIRPQYKNEKAEGELPAAVEHLFPQGTMIDHYFVTPAPSLLADETITSFGTVSAVVFCQQEGGAPWQVHLCCMRADNAETRAKADELYDALEKAGVEVLYDDRAVSAGVMFSDADLLGIPYRVIVSPRNLKSGVCELSARDKSFSEQIPLEEAPARIAGLIREKLLEFNGHKA